MRTIEATLRAELDTAEAEEMARSVGLDLVNATGYVAAESLMFRALKGAVPPYLHASQRTTIHRWANADGLWDVQVRRTSEHGPSFVMESDVCRDGEIILQQEARMRLVGSTTSSPPRERNEDESVGGETVQRWRPTADDVRLYSGWGHPNVHTDVEFARSVGLPGLIVQGLMVQNRLLSVLIPEILKPPVAVSARFRSVIPVGAEVELRSASSGQPGPGLVALCGGQVAVEVAVGPADHMVR